ncbi:MAG TPA: HI0074 family nucleotidyltransferase substrate-binding subunit [Methylomirabilota bacterium]|nr:HI0074 family nucleotidyltransferase substrate-binding subunit [Methylomirabilota bacterium]
MDKGRYAELVAQFGQALGRLAEAVAEPESGLVRDAVIQRFEFTFELAWKCLKEVCEQEGHAAPGPRAAVRTARVIGLLTDEQGDTFMSMLEARNLTTHAYHQALAEQIDFLPALKELAHTLKERRWE